MLQIFEKGIRGGYSGVLGSRHVKAFNKYTPNYRDGNRILDDNEINKRVIIQVQSFIIKCLSFRRVSFVQGYRLCIEKTLHLNNPFQ